MLASGPQQGLSDGHDLEALEIDLLLQAVARRYGYDFRGYAPASLKRRIHHAMEAMAIGTVSELIGRVLHDEHALVRFVATVVSRCTTGRVSTLPVTPRDCGAGDAVGEA